MKYPFFGDKNKINFYGKVNYLPYLSFSTDFFSILNICLFLQYNTDYIIRTLICLIFSKPKPVLEALITIIFAIFLFFL